MFSFLTSTNLSRRNTPPKRNEARRRSPAAVRRSCLCRRSCSGYGKRAPPDGSSDVCGEGRAAILLSDRLDRRRLRGRE